MKRHKPIIIDSNNYHLISAGQLKAAKASGLLCNGTEGTQYQNLYLPSQRAAAKEAGIPFGFYLFLHPDSVGSEAKYFLDFVKPKPGDFQPIVDAEVTTLGLDTLAHRVHACISALRHEGYDPILYAGYEVWNACVKAHPSLKTCPLWFAQYPGATRYSAALERYRIRLKGARVVMWQFTDAFSIHGKTFDASVCYVPVQSLLIKKGLEWK